MELRREGEEMGHSQFLYCRSVYLNRQRGGGGGRGRGGGGSNCGFILWWG